MVILNEPSSPAKKNLDHAFPPFAMGLPSVYERAGFDVNRNPRSRSGSSASSKASSLNGSRAESLKGPRSRSGSKAGSRMGSSSGSFGGSQTSFSPSGSIPQLAVNESPLIFDGPIRSGNERDMKRSSMGSQLSSGARSNLKNSYSNHSVHEDAGKPMPDSSSIKLRFEEPIPMPTPAAQPIHSEQSFPRDFKFADDLDENKFEEDAEDDLSFGSHAQTKESLHSEAPTAIDSKNSSDSEAYSEYNEYQFPHKASESSLDHELKDVAHDSAERHETYPVPPRHENLSRPSDGYLDQNVDDLEPEVYQEEPESLQHQQHLQHPLMEEPKEYLNNPSDLYQGTYPGDANSGTDKDREIHDPKRFSQISENQVYEDTQEILPGAVHSREHLPYQEEQSDALAHNLPSEDMEAQVMPTHNGAQGIHPPHGAPQLDATQTYPPNGPRPRGAPPLGIHTPQGFPPYGAAPHQGFPPQGIPPRGIPPQGFPPQGFPPYGMPLNGMPLNGMPPNGMPPNGMPPNGMPPNGMPPNGMPRGIPPQGFSSQGMPPYGMARGIPPQGMPPRGFGPQPGPGSGPGPKPMAPMGMGNEDVFMPPRQRYPKQGSKSPTVGQSGFPPSPTEFNNPGGPMRSAAMQRPMGPPPMGQPMMGRPPAGPMYPMGQPPMGQPPMGHPIMGQPPMRQPPMGQPPMGQPPMGQPPMGQPPMMHPSSESLRTDSNPDISLEASQRNIYLEDFRNASADSSATSEYEDENTKHTTADTTPLATGQTSPTLETKPLAVRDNKGLLGVQHGHRNSNTSSIYSAMAPSFQTHHAAIPKDVGLNSAMDHSHAADVSHSSEPSQASSVSFDFNQIPLTTTAPARESTWYSGKDNNVKPNLTEGKSMLGFDNDITPTLPQDGFRSESPLSSSTKTSKRGKKQCRGCMLPISGKSIRALDGTLSGRWHRECFNCTRCSDALAGVEKIHVLNDQPFCGRCYHIVNNSTCRMCGHGIEGSCLETRLSENGGQPLLYHTRCLRCAECQIKLQQSYFDVGGAPYCAEHAFTSLPDDNAVHKRYTQFMMI